MRRIALSTEVVKKHQSKIFLSLVTIVVGGGALLFVMGLEETPLPKAQMNEKAPLYDVTQALEDKSFWVFKSENRLSEQEKKQEQLMGELEDIRETLKKPPIDESKTQLEILTSRLTELEQKLTGLSALPEDTSKTAASYDSQPFLFGQEAPSHMAGGVPHVPPMGPSIFSEGVTLPNPTLENQRPHHDSYIPAGSYATAVLLSGVDVSVGISSQANPQPVLLRLIHRGSLPNKFVGKMRDCRIIAAASGELSSERAQFRLEKLSCIEPDGRVIETDVDGYISGEDGKNGMRGRLVMRDAEVLKRGFLGGLLSGLGKATSQSFNTTSVSPLGAVSSVKGGDIFKQAGAEGAGNAFDLMARYNIQRAEQYQPVIQISAGRAVTVVFHSGRQFGEQREKTKIGTKKTEPTDNFFGERP